MPVPLTELDAYLRGLLVPERFKDYAPNGLQVEGRPTVARLATGVSASLALLDAALEWGADAVLVHHGWFWNREDPRLVGPKRRRVARLLAADASLFGWHLPLDSHPDLGNNVQLARVLEIVPEGRFGDQDMGWHGRLRAVAPLGIFSERVERALGRAPLTIGDAARPVERVAWCSGGAQGYFPDAVSLGVDAYVTGEISEQHVHLARESGVAFVAAGHHATERLGVQALGAHLAAAFALEVRYFEVENPV